MAAAARNVPTYDYIFVMVNDTTYGGSGGVVSTFSVNELAGEIGLHEFGHSFAGLADEYTTPYPGYPAGGLRAQRDVPNQPDDDPLGGMDLAGNAAADPGDLHV